MNLHEVVHELTKRTPVAWNPKVPVDTGKVYTHISVPKQELPLLELYATFVKAECTLIIVNPTQVKEPMFNAGEVPVPRKLLSKFMSQVVEDSKKAETLLRGLGGCTIKEAAEFARLTMARDASLTVDGLMETRRSSFMGANGLTPVDSKQSFYDPPDALVGWVKRERQFFLTGTDPRLIPRGLLFDGPPGTGKTSGAKWLAEQLGVPLYRMDIGGTKSKWVGESEAQMLTNLARVDHEAPAVALFDEVEKVFSTTGNDASGTTTTMLSQLLWWLAERRSRVLVVMTTNNAKALPRELYREGRVDEVLWMNGLDLEKSRAFVERLVLTFPTLKLSSDSKTALVDSVLKDATVIPNTKPVMWAQSALTKATYTKIKKISNKGA
ncbi:AAA family ATPase [Hyphomicrobium sp.]|uniref:ATP-binding protein n=1 Tax=Hyphomicrobium sp. TaxID=82 RepID=UPI001DAF5850|nr:AAA family ATPase [Hyphomicrobium sp.]MBY0560029.1 AAA family ATPase [Hyphomicrobium sp.]